MLIFSGLCGTNSLIYLWQEVLKVKGFQVTPAELEGHLLLHSDIVDSCIVGIKDDYSGELPFAYVVLRPTSAERIKGNPAAAQELKKSIFKVRTQGPTVNCNISWRVIDSMWLIPRFDTSGWLEVSNFWMLYPRILPVKLWAGLLNPVLHVHSTYISSVGCWGRRLVLFQHQPRRNFNACVF